MKRKVRIIDNVNREEIVSEKEIPNKDHFEVQLKTKANIFVDRKKRLKNGYRKHKTKTDQED